MEIIKQLLLVIKNKKDMLLLPGLMNHIPMTILNAVSSLQEILTAIVNCTETI